MLKMFLTQVQELLSSPVFLACIFSWFCAQFLKTLIHLFSGKVHSVKELIDLCIWRTGGMPSAHSSIVACLVTSIAYNEGVKSNTFILALIFYMVVVRDALGVRRANGIQARILNKLGSDLNSQGILKDYKKVKEVQGHTPMEVIVGSFLGFFIGTAFSVL